MKNIKNVLMFTLIFIRVYETSYSQTSSEIWIKVKDYFPSGRQDTMTDWFGNHIDGHFYPRDTINLELLGGCMLIREISNIPFPVAFASLWRNIKNRPLNPYPLLIYDFREIPTNATKKDTFHLLFQNEYFKDSADFLFKWPSVSYLNQRCDSMWLNYIDPNAVPISQWVNMFAVDSLVIPLATLREIRDLWIYKYGCKLVDDCINEVKVESPAVPIEFSLYQNYPNPFNLSTVIRYQLPVNSWVTLKIYNLLEQEVATLVDEFQDAGCKSVEWDASRMASGMYFFRITAQNHNKTKKMLLLR